MFPFFFLSGRNDPKRRETLELDKGTMVGVNERLKREATSYPARVERKEGSFYAPSFLFCLFFPLTLVDREAGLFFHFLFRIPFICYITRFFYFSIYIRMYIKKRRVSKYLS